MSVKCWFCTRTSDYLVYKEPVVGTEAIGPRLMCDLCLIQMKVLLLPWGLSPEQTRNLYVMPVDADGSPSATEPVSFNSASLLIPLDDR